MIYVAGYCRVSTDRDDQSNSFEAQQRYFREYISHRPDWKLYEIYADEGISGTGTKKRHQFNRMLQDAHLGKFSIILTKEVSRFSRNILDTISYTRELKKLGIGIHFLLDGIDTLNHDAELHLSIMASLAQEESRKTSCRVTWGQTRQMERGIVFGHSLLGYDVRNGRITVEPEGAETVRIIFQKYTLEKLSGYQIARFLMDSNRKTLTGSTHWSSQTVLKILRNEKYAGDLIQRKTYTPDFLTHEKKPNYGKVPLVCIKDHHEPIISRNLWKMTQRRLSQRSSSFMHSGKVAGCNIFSGKILCESCGKPFVTRYKYYTDGRKLRRWSCGTAVSQGTHRCRVGKLIRDDDALQMLKTALAALQLDRERIVSQISEAVKDAVSKEMTQLASNRQNILSEIQKLQRKKEAAMDSYFEQLISKEELRTMQIKYDSRLDSLNRQIAGDDTNLETSFPKNDEISQAVRSILSGTTDSRCFYSHILHRLTVYPDRHMELHFNELDMVFYFTE